MNLYSFVVAYYRAHEYVDVRRINVVATCVEDAWRKFDGGVFDSDGDFRQDGVGIRQHNMLIKEVVDPPDSAQLARLLRYEGLGLSLREEHGAAWRLLKTAFLMEEKVLGASHLELASTLDLLGREYAALHYGEAAIAMHERAIDIRETGGDRPENIAFSRFLLAKTLWKVGGERTQALEIARAASKAICKHATKELEEVRMWLDSHDHLCKTCGRLYSPDEEERACPREYTYDFDELCLLCSMGIGSGDPDSDDDYNPDATAFGGDDRLKEIVVVQPDGPGLARDLLGAARALSRRGECTKARELLVRSIELFEEAFGPAHRELALPLDLLGRMLVKLGDAGAAVSVHERAIVIRELYYDSDENMHFSRFLLGRALSEACASALGAASADGDAAVGAGKVLPS